MMQTSSGCVVSGNDRVVADETSSPSHVSLRATPHELVDLYRALGGGWIQRTGDTPRAPDALRETTGRNSGTVRDAPHSIPLTVRRRVLTTCLDLGSLASGACDFRGARPLAFHDSRSRPVGRGPRVAGCSERDGRNGAQHQGREEIAVQHEEAPYQIAPKRERI